MQTYNNFYLSNNKKIDVRFKIQRVINKVLRFKDFYGLESNGNEAVLHTPQISKIITSLLAAD